jgi:hypothetical protein
MAVQIPLIAQDKANHIVYGSLISIAALSALLVASRQHPMRAAALALCATVVAAWLKEAYDARYRDIHTPDPWDLVATSSGGVLAMASVFIVRCFQ